MLEPPFSGQTPSQPQSSSHVVVGGGGVPDPNRFMRLFAKVRSLLLGGGHAAALTGASLVVGAGLITGGVLLVSQHFHHDTADAPTAQTNKQTAQNTPGGSQQTSNGTSKSPDKTPDTAKPPASTTTPKAGSTTGGSSSSGGTTGGGTTGGGTTGSGGGGSTRGCPLPAYPDASCTGVPAGTHLTVHNGDMTINTANAVIDSMDIVGCIDVEAPGVVIKNSRIRCYDFLGIATNGAALSGTRLVVEDSEINCADGSGNPGPGTAITDGNFNAFRNDIWGCENGFSNDGDNDIEDNYIHDLFQGDASHPDPHTDGLQSPDGSNSIIKHNNFDMGNGNVTSAIIYNNNPSGPSTHDVTISNNLFAGGGYTLYCPRVNDPNFQILNNHFSTKYFSTVGAYGPTSDCGNETQSGNVYHETGLPLSTPLG